MRLFCPSCQKSITVPDESAGQTVVCPECQASFPAPRLFDTTPAVPAPDLGPPPATSSPPGAAPPPLSPPARVEPIPAPPLSGDLTPPPGYTRRVAVSLRPAVVQAIVPAGLVLAFLLTFFTWIGCFPAGYGVYTQNAWQAMIGWFSTDPVGDNVFQAEEKLTGLVRGNWLLLPYLLGLLAAAAWAVLLTVSARVPLHLPDPVRRLWPQRVAILTGLTVGTLAVLVVQLGMFGLGLDNAVFAMAEKDLADQVAKARTGEEKQRVQMERAKEIGQLNPGRTGWLGLAVLAHLSAAGGVGLEYWLTRRGAQPLPRLELLW